MCYLGVLLLHKGTNIPLYVGVSDIICMCPHGVLMLPACTILWLSGFLAF